MTTRDRQAQEHAPHGGRRLLHVTGRLDRHAFGIRPAQRFEWVVGQDVDQSARLVFVP